jgi:hypothetical protein
MTITRLWQAGAESGSVNEFDAVYGDGNFTISAPGQGKTGTYSFRTSKQYNHGVVNVPTTQQVRVGWWFYGHPSYYDYMFAIRDVSQNRLVGLFHNSGSNSLYVNGVDRGTVNNVCIYEWMHYGIDAKIDGSSGWVNWYVDGVLVGSYSGNTGTAGIVTVSFGKNGYNTVDYNLYYDDIYIDDTTGEAEPAPLPLKRFYFVKPNADGNYSQWTPSSGSGADHYADVDEVPPSDSDYLEALSAGLYDSHQMTTFTLYANQTIQSIIPVARALKTGVNEKLNIGTRLSGTDLISDLKDLNTSPSYIWERQATKPGGGSWQQADLDAFEVVLLSAGSF